MWKSSWHLHNLLFTGNRLIQDEKKKGKHALGLSLRNDKRWKAVNKW